MRHLAGGCRHAQAWLSGSKMISVPSAAEVEKSVPQCWQPGWSRARSDWQDLHATCFGRGLSDITARTAAGPSISPMSCQIACPRASRPRVFAMRFPNQHAMPAERTMTTSGIPNASGCRLSSRGRTPTPRSEIASVRPFTEVNKANGATGTMGAIPQSIAASDGEALRSAN